MTAAALPRPQLHSDWLARLRTIGLGLGGRGVLGMGLGRTAASAASPWWLAGGAPTPVAAYQPKSAASLAASYVNLANPGTYDAAPGTAPGFDAATGWTFNGSSQYLTTSIIPATTAWSALVRLSDGTGNGQVFGNRRSGSNDGYHIHPTYVGTTIYFRNAGNYNKSPVVASGVIGIVGKAAYINGASVGTIDTSASLTDVQIFIGASLNKTDGAVTNYYNCKIQAFAIYNTTLTAPQVAAISAAMAAL